MTERTYEVLLTESEILFIASAMSERVHSHHPTLSIEDSDYAAKVWHHIVPEEWKGQVVQ